MRTFTRIAEIRLLSVSARIRMRRIEPVADEHHCRRGGWRRKSTSKPVVAGKIDRRYESQFRFARGSDSISCTLEELSTGRTANDVLMMSELLRESYGFAPESIVILSEKTGEKRSRKLPTRENIKRECERISREARSGDRVIVAMSDMEVSNPSTMIFRSGMGWTKRFCLVTSANGRRGG